tara:strand:+ start:324 stop:581 length:258 start_codon:yes stop_codon:yes gene_type:complete
VTVIWQKLKVGDVIFIAPYCADKFEMGEVIEDLCGGLFAVRLWGINKHPDHRPSAFNYSTIKEVRRANGWNVHRLEEAIEEILTG